MEKTDTIFSICFVCYKTIRLNCNKEEVKLDHMAMLKKLLIFLVCMFLMILVISIFSLYAQDPNPDMDGILVSIGTNI